MSEEEKTPSTADTASVVSVPRSLAQSCDPSSSLGGAATSNYGTIEAVTLYLSRNAPRGVSDITSFRDQEGRTALHWAISFRNAELASTLLYGPYKEEALMLMKSATGGARGVDGDKSLKHDADDQQRGTAATASDSQHQQQQQQQQQEKREDAQFCAHWALPPDASGTTVLATACAVGAELQFAQDLITIATGLPVPQIGSAADPTSIVNLSASVSAAPASSSLTDAAASASATIAAAKEVKPASHPLFDAEDSGGNKALHIAASRGNMKLVTLLLAYGTDARSVNKRKQTCLHRLIGKGDIAAVESLLHFSRRKFPLAAKSFVNMADANGDTALHYASMEENREMGEFLLRNGANRELRNKQGKEFWQL